MNHPETQPKTLMIVAVLGTTALYATAVLSSPLAATWLIPLAVAVLLWVPAIVQSWRGLASAALVLTLGLLASATIAGLSPLLMVAAAVLALAAWQFNHMAWRFTRAGRIEDHQRLMLRMLTRIGLFAALSMALALLPTLVELELTFVVGVALALLTAFALSRIVRILNPSEEETA